MTIHGQISADLYGGKGAKADYDGIIYLYWAEKYKADRVATAATNSDWKKINKVFGSEIEGIAEIGSIKCRFGDPNVRETLKFEAQYTRYVSMRQEREGIVLMSICLGLIHGLQHAGEQVTEQGVQARRGSDVHPVSTSNRNKREVVCVYDSRAHAGQLRHCDASAP